MRFVCSLALIGLCLAGCGGSQSGQVIVKGALFNGTQPVAMKDDVMKSMIFFPYPDVGEGKLKRTYPAAVRDDGSFEVTQIPPGKYLIALELLAEKGDLCMGRFTKDNSKLIREITGKETLKIDISKPKGE